MNLYIEDGPYQLVKRGPLPPSFSTAELLLGARIPTEQTVLRFKPGPAKGVANSGVKKTAYMRAEQATQMFEANRDTIQSMLIAMATNEQIGKAVGVTSDRIQRWIARCPDLQILSRKRMRFFGGTGGGKRYQIQYQQDKEAIYEALEADKYSVVAKQFGMDSRTLKRYLDKDKAEQC
jgi:hypothetical protein